MGEGQADTERAEGHGIPADRILIVFAALCVVAVLVIGLGGGRTASEGGAAPDFQLALYGGGETRLADYEGRILVINFWASWCGPCRAELPALQAAWTEYRGRGVAFLGITVRDVAERAQALIDEFGLTYPNAYDPYNTIWQSYGLTGVPETVFVAADGVIAKRFIGQISQKALRAELDALLEASEKGTN